MTIETKLQIEALKMLDKDGNKPLYAESESSIYFSLNGYYAICILKNHFFLNPTCLKFVPSLAKFFNYANVDNTQKLIVTDESYKLLKGTGIILRCDKFDTCINSDFLKMFLPLNCEIYAKDSKSAIYFVSNDEIHVAVMPIRVSKRLL